MPGDLSYPRACSALTIQKNTGGNQFRCVAGARHFKKKKKKKKELKRFKSCIWINLMFQVSIVGGGGGDLLWKKNGVQVVIHNNNITKGLKYFDYLK